MANPASSIANNNKEKHSLDAAALRDLQEMFHSEPSILSAHQSYCAATLSTPFTFRIPRMGLVSQDDMNRLIARYWMPWLQMVRKALLIVGVCPYYFERRGELHAIPVVPDFDLGEISVVLDAKTHRLGYEWAWNHNSNNANSTQEKKMLWILSAAPPSRYGALRSPLASLLPRYRTLKILRGALGKYKCVFFVRGITNAGFSERAATQNSEVSHLLEYHPPAATAKNDDLTGAVVNFGEKAAGLSRARQELARAKDIRVRLDEVRLQVAQMQHQNTASLAASRPRPLLWTEDELDELQRLDTGFDRMIPLPPDHKYVNPARAQIVAELDRYQNAFDVDAAAAVGYAYELIRPTGAARTQNVAGGVRFVTERIREGVAFFTQVAQAALIIAYERQFSEGFDAFHRWQINRTGGNHEDVAALHPEMDVEIQMSATPSNTYAELKQMWMDGILSKEDFATHAFQLYAMSPEQISVTLWPDKVPKELLVKQQPQQKQQKQQKPPEAKAKAEAEAKAKAERPAKRNKTSADA